MKKVIGYITQLGLGSELKVRALDARTKVSASSSCSKAKTEGFKAKAKIILALRPRPRTPPNITRRRR